MLGKKKGLLVCGDDNLNKGQEIIKCWKRDSFLVVHIQKWRESPLCWLAALESARKREENCYIQTPFSKKLISFYLCSINSDLTRPDVAQRI